MIWEKCHRYLAFYNMHKSHTENTIFELRISTIFILISVNTIHTHKLTLVKSRRLTVKFCIWYSFDGLQNCYGNIYFIAYSVIILKKKNQRVKCLSKSKCLTCIRLCVGNIVFFLSCTVSVTSFSLCVFIDFIH